MKTRSILCFLSLAVSLHAEPSASANYSVSTQTFESGGERTTSANYTNQGSFSTIAGSSSAAAAGITTNTGFVGQLYEITGFGISAGSAAVNENTTRQMVAGWVLDDATILAFAPSLVTWSVLSGPLTSITSGGVVSAGSVFQTTSASVRGVFDGNTASVTFSVANVNPDNFGSYAGDGLDDAWQVQHFGLNSPSAGPGADPDADGDTNLFEFTAGLDPTNWASHFSLTIAPVSGQPGQHALTFAPVITGRTYTVQFKNSLGDPNWQPLTGAPQSDNGNARTVTDTAINPARVYRVNVDKP